MIVRFVYIGRIVDHHCLTFFHDFSYIVLVLPLTVNQLILQWMSFHLFVFYNKYNLKTNLMIFIGNGDTIENIPIHLLLSLDNRNILIRYSIQYYV